MNKAVRAEGYQRGIKMLHDRGIVTYGSFIVGFPGETEGTVNETAEFIDQNPLDFFRVEPWFYAPHQPIQERAAEFRLTGEAYGWQHATMNGDQALDHCDRIFRNANPKSIWLALRDFDFWALPYLMSKGVEDLAQMKQLLRSAHDLMQLNFGSGSPTEDPRYETAAVALRQAISGLDLQPAKYSVSEEEDDDAGPTIIERFSPVWDDALARAGHLLRGSLNLAR
jgi:p-methyltransferase